jgi:hypothetical protein
VSVALPQSARKLEGRQEATPAPQKKAKFFSVKRRKQFSFFLSTRVCHAFLQSLSVFPDESGLLADTP